jgi:hypothetical protein
MSYKDFVAQATIAIAQALYSKKLVEDYIVADAVEKAFDLADKLYEEFRDRNM